ncbi:MAG: glycosyltransferase family 4 protein [Eubacterium sp.]|nr:glycosyltransferase family 4 protein [Eubacterium sp.]
MKILMVNKFLYPNGGSETYIFKLGDCLKALGHEVEYFGMEHEGNCVSNSLGLYTGDMDFHTASKLTQLSYTLKTVYSPEAKKKMRLLLESFAPDVVHLNNFNYQLTPSVIYAVKDYEKKTGKRVKIIYTAHDYQLVCPNHMMLDSFGNICEKCAKGDYMSCFKNSCVHSSKAKSLIGSIEASLYKALKAYKHIDAVICPSEFMKTKLDLNPALKGKTLTLHNFIDKAPVGKTEKEDYVLYFGRYSKEKGIKNILEAKGINFICAGSGELEKEIEKAGIKNVGFKTGRELEELISKAVCSVYPSTWYENCPFSVMESISLGTPVIGADIGGIPELIENGKTGFLFKSGNTADMEEKIKALTENSSLANEMSRNCLDYKFDTAEAYTKKLLKIYETEG